MGWSAVALGVSLSLLTGCEDRREDDGRLAALEKQGAEMNASLDRVEERLLAGQARVDLWSELAERHQHVSALACQNAQSQAMIIARNVEHQQEKQRAMRRQRLAAVQLAGGHAPAQGGRLANARGVDDHH